VEVLSAEYLVTGVTWSLRNTAYPNRCIVVFSPVYIHNMFETVKQISFNIY